MRLKGYRRLLRVTSRLFLPFLDVFCYAAKFSTAKWQAVRQLVLLNCHFCHKSGKITLILCRLRVVYRTWYQLFHLLLFHPTRKPYERKRGEYCRLSNTLRRIGYILHKIKQHMRLYVLALL